MTESSQDRQNPRSIQLDRIFFDVADVSGTGDLDERIWTAKALGRGMTWPQLLVHPYIVVLGEAGTGKTTEFQFQAASLSQAGAHAFFVEINPLAREGLYARLDPQAKSRLDKWLESQENATFFLDSLDEAKLQKHTLKDALLKLHMDLRDSWARVRLVISCRATDWKEYADRADLQSFAPLSSESPGVGVKVVQLSPLQNEQVERLAHHLGITPVSQFMRAIDDNFAHTFIERPIDVEWIGAYWKHHGHLGSYRDLINENIDQKLAERRDQSSDLPLTRMREGVGALSGIATLTHRLSIMIPGGSLDPNQDQFVLQTKDALADWSPQEIKNLLSRGIFDEATFGRVRFHHRSIQEYLTACWLRDLTTHGLPPEKMRELFLREEAGETVVPMHLQPVLAWLCLWDAPLRTEVIQKCPAILISYGDPQGLQDSEREEVMISYAQSYRSRSRLFDNFELPSLARFASPALAPVVTKLLDNVSQSDELRSMLLELVELGKVEACAPSALSAALDENQGTRVRTAAIRTVAAVGDPSQKTKLLALLNSTTTWSQNLTHAFIKATYPDQLTAKDLVQLLAQVDPTPLHNMTSLQMLLEHDVPQRSDARNRLMLLEYLLDLIHKDGEHGQPSIVPGFDWLLGATGSLVAAILDDRPGSAEWPPLISKALKLLQKCSRQGHETWHCMDEVRKATARYPEIRRRLFWQHVDDFHTTQGYVPTRVYELRYSGDLFELGSEDIPWLQRDASTRGHVRERLLAFDALARVPRTQDRNEQHLDMLRSVASNDSALIARLERMQDNARTSDPEDAKWARLQRARALRKERKLQQSHKALRHDIDSIRDGTNLSALCHLLWVEQRGDGGNSWGGSSTDKIREIYDDEIADASVAGWRAFWRTYDPPLPHEQDERNSTPWATIIGLVGLNADIDAGLDLNNLDAPLIVKAIRYAACELNRFPEWLTTLADRHPDLVNDVLEPAIKADYGEDQVVHDVLAKLPLADLPVKHACAPALLHLITTDDSPKIESFHQVLAVLLSVPGIDLAPLDAIIGDHCRRSVNDCSRFGIWWMTWVRRHSNEAMDYLEELLDSKRREEVRDLVEELCCQIHEDHRDIAISLPRDASLLSRLIPIVYDYISIDDDITHDGAYTPRRRDHAQQVRGQLVQWLAEASGSDIVESLRRIADDPRVASLREWILHQADTRIATDAGRQMADVAAELVELYGEFGTQAQQHLSQLKGGVQSMKILFLAANPSCSTHLDLDQEVRQVRQKLRAAELRDSITLNSRWAVQPGDLQQDLLEEEPTIVHFSGHGDEHEGLVLHSVVSGAEHRVPTTAMISLFQALKDKIRIVVFNTCESDELARAISETIDFTVGMSDSIDDQAAISFAAGFYQGLGFGRSIQSAFDLGISEMKLAGYAEDAKIPRLHTREEVDPATVSLLPRAGSQ